jgi:hypothetical protein
MKLTRVIQPAVTEEVEITFPVYRSNNDLFFYKLVDENNITQVTINKYACFNGIENMKHIPNMVFNETSIEITEAEFEAKFNEAIELLTNLAMPKKCKGCNCTITEGQFCQGCCVDGTAYGKKWSLD